MLPSVGELIRAAEQMSIELDMRIGRSKLARLVRTFIATQRSHEDFAQYLLSYADPTGERAVRNVLRAGTRGAS